MPTVKNGFSCIIQFFRETKHWNSNTPTRKYHETTEKEFIMTFSHARKTISSYNQNRFA